MLYPVDNNYYAILGNMPTDAKAWLACGPVEINFISPNGDGRVVVADLHIEKKDEGFLRLGGRTLSSEDSRRVHIRRMKNVVAGAEVAWSISFDSSVTLKQARIMNRFRADWLLGARFIILIWMLVTVVAFRVGRIGSLGLLSLVMLAGVAVLCLHAKRAYVDLKNNVGSTARRYFPVGIWMVLIPVIIMVFFNFQHWALT